MKRVFAVSLLGLAFLLAYPRLYAAEGAVADPVPPAPDASRVSSYVDGRASDAPAAAVAATKQSSKRHSSRAATKTSAAKTVRAAASPSSRSSFFSFFDAASTLRLDRDDDGFHSEFRIRFDADSTVGDVLVFARLYLRRVGDRDWLLYHETDDFWIFGESDDDDYFVTTSLDDGFPTGDYDVLIDLYEACCSGIVATIGPADSSALSLLPLEERGLDMPIEMPGFSIGVVSTTLIIDDDADGHYSTFRVDFDPDAELDGTFVYAVVWVRAQGGEWIQEHVTDDFLVDASGDDDVYSFTADWLSGYPTAFYDVQIDLFHADTSALVASAGSERPELSRVPLEDQQRDLRPNPPVVGDGGIVTSRERGGGALTPWFVLALVLLATLRYRAQGRRVVSQMFPIGRGGSLRRERSH
jgi:hypothetical protein